MRTYGGLARFVIEMGAPVIEALHNLEIKHPNLTAWNLRNLEQLLTPDARGEVMVTLNAPLLKMQDLEKAIQTARHKMWAKFVWTMHPDIDPSKSVHTSYTKK